uniref:carbonic anhydrase 4-like n=1 Tax=Pristiophorus japonicus TaxID=55135 RepID=UPI00398EFBC8
MEAVLILLFLGLRQLESATAPAHWPALYPTCNGTRQSPIDIKTKEAVRNNDLGKFLFLMYDERQFLTTIKHTAMTVKVTLNTRMQLRAGGLNADYVAAQFHLHWGKSIGSGGSEHTIDGKQADMELHIVHRQKGLSLTNVFARPDGLAVLGFHIMIEHGISEDPAWKNLTKIIKHLKDDGDYQHLNDTVSLMDLIRSVNLTKYYRYNGSLTTPECNQVVVWTVFEEPIRLNASVVETFFEDLYVNRTSGIKLRENFRPTQHNRNQVYASRGATKAMDTGTGNNGSGKARGSPLLLLALASLYLHSS